MKNFSQNFHFSFCQNFQYENFEIWPLLCTPKNSWFFENRALAVFWHFGENREKDVKSRPKPRLRPKSAEPRIFKNWSENRIFGKFLPLPTNRNFDPKMSQKFDQKCSLEGGYCKAIKSAQNLAILAIIAKPAYFTKEIASPPKNDKFYASKRKKKLPRKGEQKHLHALAIKKNRHFLYFSQKISAHVYFS